VRLRQTFAGKTDGFTACYFRRDRDPQIISRHAAHGFRAALQGTLGINLQIAAQIGGTNLEPKIRPRLHAHEQESTAIAGQAKARTRRGVRGHDKLVGFRAGLIGKIIHHYFKRGAAQEIFKAQLNFLGEVAHGLAGNGGGRFPGGEFSIVFPAPHGIAQDFVGGVVRLRLGDGRARTAVNIGMVLLGEQPVSGADLVIGAIPVKTERGVMIWCGGLQVREISKCWTKIPAPLERGCVVLDQAQPFDALRLVCDTAALRRDSDLPNPNEEFEEKFSPWLACGKSSARLCRV